MKKHMFWAYAAIACMVMCVWTAKPTAKDIERGRLPRTEEAALTLFAQIDTLSCGPHSELRQRYFSSYCGISVSSTSSKLPS